MRPPYTAVLCFAVVSAASAQNAPRPYEGAWNWDRAAFVAPDNMPELHHMVAETMLVYRDDGQRFAAHIDQVFDEGQRRTIHEDFAEDGRPHAAGTEMPAETIAIRVAADASRHVVSQGFGGESHDMLCHVSGDTMTLSCTGRHVMPDGRSGDVIYIYHRDLNVIPVS